MLTSSSPGSSTGALQIPSQRTRGCVSNWVAPLESEVNCTPCPHGLPGNPESPEFLKPCPAARWEAPPKFPPEPAAKGGRREGGAGTRGRNRDSRAPRVCELGCSTASRTGQLAAAPRSGDWEREPRFPARSPLARPLARPPEAWALGPPKGRRAHGAALTALCSPAPPARPLAPRPPPPRPPLRSPGQIQRRRARGRGLGDGKGGRGRCKCYNFLRCPRPGGPGTRRGEGSARAPMSSLSFSPPRAPPRASRPAPPTSSTGQNPRFSVRGVGGWRRRGRKERRER
ncbi:uncharacterized protein LOC114612694 [Grammomys surdaster]|uniref:uncharacterized protein LOC114612694 n=1 Tax=Grammomys surdaster TaxID=491861 RepID=UPI00109FE90A|nr:uncharacterized protein LOC114612694 [Grammomys surdaster]